MARVSASEAAEKWARNTAAASQDVVRGVQRVTQAPGAKAAAQKGKWLQKTTAAADKFATNAAAVSLQEWQAAAVEGASRIASGVQSKKGKQERFMTEFLAHLDRGAAGIAAMPTNDLESSIQKMAAQVRHNASFKRTGAR